MCNAWGLNATKPCHMNLIKSYNILHYQTIIPASPCSQTAGLQLAEPYAVHVELKFTFTNDFFMEIPGGPFFPEAPWGWSIYIYYICK